MKTLYKTITILTCLLINLYADDAPVQPVPGGSVQTFQHTDIQLKNEIIDVDLYNNKYDVTVQYVFVNNGNKQEVIMGFPNKTDAIYTKTISNFKAYANGKEMKIYQKFDKNSDKKEEYEAKDFFECFDIVFEKGETKNIKNTYSQIYEIGYDADYRKAEYILKTGALWKDRIERIDLRVHFKDIPIHEIGPRKIFFDTDQYDKNKPGIYSRFTIHPETPSYKINKDTAYITYTDIDPEFDIAITMPPPLRHRTRASSTLKHKKDIYTHRNLIDNDQTTAWVEGKKGYGIHENINIIFEPSAAGGKISGAYLVKKIGIINGYAKSEKIFKENSRVKKAGITLSAALEGLSGNYKEYEKKYTFDLKDHSEEQFLILKEPVLAGSLSLEILDVYKGTKYEDTCISEIYIYVEE